MAGKNGYSFGVEKLDTTIGSIPVGSNLMLIGPPMSGKSIFARTFMYNGIMDSEAGIYVSTKDTGGKIEEWYTGNSLSLEQYRDAYGIIDCLSKSLRMEVGEKSENVIEVSSAIDMTGISAGVNTLLNEFLRTKGKSKVRVVVESLSNLLMYSNIQTVFRFLHVFTGRVRAAGALGLYVIEEGMHDAKAITTIKQLLQGIIEVKEEEGKKRYLRVVGLTPSPTPWFEYNIKGNDIILEGGTK